MKIIIVEGCDNLGKTTLINNLKKHFDSKYNVIIKHSGKPSNSDMDALDEQRMTFLSETMELFNLKQSESDVTKEHLVIYDRFVQGEYVWGSIYRGYSIDDIKNRCVLPVMKNLTFNIGQENIISILLDASSHFIHYNDDGKSLYSDIDMDKMIELIKYQRMLFKDVMTNFENYYCFKNNIIYNVQDESSIYTYGDFIFKSENKICNDIIKLINEKINLDNYED